MNFVNKQLSEKATKKRQKAHAEIFEELKERAKSHNPAELKEFLPTLFAQDVSDWAGDKKKFVIFLDTCEVLSEKNLGANNLPPDWWLADKKRGGLIFTMPTTLWTFAGRNKLTWREPELQSNTESHMLKNLSEPEAAKLLTNANVSGNFHYAITKLTEGYPLYIEACADAHEELSHKVGEVVTADKVIEQARVLILERLLKNLDARGKTMLQELSEFDTWTDALARKKLSNFNPHTYEKIKNLSFVEVEGSSYRLSPLFRKIIAGKKNFVTFLSCGA